MTRSLSGSVLLLAAVVVSVGCSLITNLDTLGFDVPGDGGAEVAPDASADGGSPPPSADAGFCAAYAEAGPLTYCQDFDSITDASMLSLSVHAATATVDTNDWASPSASLLLDIPVTDAGGFKAYLFQDIAVEPMTVTLDFDTKVETVGSMAVNVATLELTSTTGTSRLALQILPSAFAIQENTPRADGGNVLTTHPDIPFTWDTSWHHVQMILSLESPPRSSLAIDGRNLEANYRLAAGWAKGLFTLLVGVTYVQRPSGHWLIRDDSIVARLSL